MMTQRKISRHDWVRVKRTVQGRSEPVWADGKVTEVVGKGCFVQTEDGNRNFYNWNQIMLVDLKSERPRKALATIGDAVGAKLEAKVAPAPEPTPAPKLHVVEPKPKEPTPSSPLRRAPPIRAAVKEHEATPIGARFKSERMRLGFYQREFAEVLGSAQSALSKIELGDELPSNELLARFAKETSQPLDELKRLRDHTLRARVEGQPTPLTQPPEPAQAVAPEPPKPEQPPAPQVDHAAELQAFIDRVDELAPMPADREKRKAWFAAVKALFELRQ